MAHGENTANHAGRQVGPHLSQHWRPVSAGSHTGPLGEAFARMDPNDAGISSSAWSGPEGHYGAVDQDRDDEHHSYLAGPYRKPERAQMAAEALENRIERGGNTDRYQRKY